MNNWLVAGLMFLAWGVISGVLIFLFGKLRRRKWRVLTKRCIKRNRHIVGAVLIATLIVPIVAYISKFSINGLSGDPSQWGQMGDFFGGMLNPVLAFASFIALLYTIKIQVEELRLTRTELQLTRIEMSRAAEATEKSSEATEKASEAAASQLLLSRMQNDEKIFYKSIEKVQNDILNIKRMKFKLRYFYNGSDSQPVSSDSQPVKSYVRVKKEKPYILEVDFNRFIGIYLNKGGHFSVKIAGYDNTFRFGSHLDHAKNDYSILDTASADELKGLLVRHISIFDRLSFSLSYALHTIEQMELYYPPKRNFTFYYYSYLVDIIDPDFLVLLAIFFNHQRVIDYDKLAKFNFFERLVVNKEGYIGNGQIHVINDLSLPAETYGVNPGYLHAKQAKETST